MFRASNDYAGIRIAEDHVPRRLRMRTRERIRVPNAAAVISLNWPKKFDTGFKRPAICPSVHTHTASGAAFTLGPPTPIPDDLFDLIVYQQPSIHGGMKWFS